MNREPIKKVGTDGRSLPRHVYLRRGKYLYVEKRGYRPVRLYERPGTEAFLREYDAAVAHLPARRVGKGPTPPVNIQRKQHLSQDRLQRALDYNPETGTLSKKALEPCDFSPSKRSTPEALCHMWNARHAGKPAFDRLTEKGYLVGTIFGQTQLAHRVIWALVHGVWPDTVDHINGIPTDNRLANLRAANMTDQARNLRMSPKNTSGVMGVTRYRNKWRAFIGAGGVHVYLGLFEAFDDAVAARKQAERDFGYHPNHGRVPVNVGTALRGA